MMNSRTIVESLSSADLRSATQELVRRSHGLDAKLLVHLGEIDERKLYLEWTFSSMFAFCVGELGFSEDVACNRIDLARAARRMPVILEALRSGRVHLACHDKFRKAQDLATIVEKALELLIEQVQKDRFATGRKARQAPVKDADVSPSRHIPDAIKREVFERDGGRCTFTDEHGRRCGETGALEFDHLDGFARTRLHRADRIRLLCRAHNQHAAELMYGRAFMERARASVDRLAARPGTPSG